MGEDHGTFDDLQAIWDAHNGNRVEPDLKGLPAGWKNNCYGSATPTTSAGHAAFAFDHGVISDDTEGNGFRSEPRVPIAWLMS